MTWVVLPSMEEAVVRRLRRRLLIWAARNGRDFWWRHQRDLYTTAVVEVLLKQTRAQGTDEKIRDFVLRYPTPSALAGTSISQLERDLQPFGLHRQRAAQLHALGNYMASDQFKSGHAIRKLAPIPGVGPYTMSAIRCFVYGKREAVVDVNIVRIVSRVFDIQTERGELRKNKTVALASNALLAGPQPRRMNWALLDLGALVCTERKPKCGECPLLQLCAFGKAQLSGG